MNRREFLKRAAAAVGLVAAGAVASEVSEQATAEAAAHDQHALGYGRCSRCSCERFDGRGQTCRCGHGFYQHYV